MAVKALTVDMGNDELKPLIRKFIGEDRKGIVDTWKVFVNDVTTDEFFIEDARLGGFGDFPLLDEGQSINFALPDLGDKTRIQPERRQLAYAITMVDKRFNKIQKVQKYGRKLNRAAQRTIEKVAILPFNLGFDTSYKISDGQTVFSTAHVRLNGNLTANTPLTQVDLTPASLEAAIVAYMQVLDEDGTVIHMSPRFLVIHPANYMNAKRILGATNYYTGAGGVGNPPNAPDTGVINYIKEMGITLVSDPYLTNIDFWALVCDKSEHEYSLVSNEKTQDRTFTDPYNEDSIYSMSFSCVAAVGSDIGLYGSSGA